jgi:hypothetical protein
MKAITLLIILTIVFYFFILAGAGHGIGFMGLFQFLAPVELFHGTITFTITGRYEDRLLTAALIGIAGQTVLAISLFKQPLQKFRLLYAGLLILLFAFFVLTNHFSHSAADRFSFWSGTPFLAAAILLLVFTIKKHWRVLNANKI